MYLGNKFTDRQINEMLEDKKQIKYDSDSYKEFDKRVKYCLGSYYINKTGDNNENIIPLLSEFAGKDKQGGSRLGKNVLGSRRPDVLKFLIKIFTNLKSYIYKII